MNGQYAVHLCIPMPAHSNIPMSEEVISSSLLPIDLFMGVCVDALRTVDSVYMNSWPYKVNNNDD